MVQRYYADKISKHPEGAITLYTDYAALKQRCKEAEKRAGDRWKELDAERQNHAITKRELASEIQKCKELEALKEELMNTLVQSNAILEAIDIIISGGEVSDFMESFGSISQVKDIVAENAELRKKINLK